MTDAGYYAITGIVLAFFGFTLCLLWVEGILTSIPRRWSWHVAAWTLSLLAFTYLVARIAPKLLGD